MVETKFGIETLPDTARVWVYQSDRPLTNSEQMELENMTTRFVEGWNAHGQKLSAGFDFLHGHFLILSVDESDHAASGCSIDSSVGLIRDLSARFEIDFLNRTKVAIWENGEVVLLALPKLKEEVTSGRLKPESLVFNNLISTIGDFKRQWLIPASQSWLKRYF